VSLADTKSKVSPDETPGAIASEGMTVGGYSPGDKPFDFWRAVHRALRGRYRLALLLATGGAAAGSFAGLRVGQRLYGSSGLVRIASVLPQVMYVTDQNGPLAMFDGFMAAQREVMSSPDMIQAAMRDPTWRGLPQNSHVPTIGQFAANLKVENRFRSEYLKITYTDRDPTIAATAVQSLIGAYQRTYVREHDRAESHRLAELKARRATLTNDLEEVEAEVDPEASGRTAVELEPVYNAAVDRARRLRASLMDVQCIIAGVPNPNSSPALAPAPAPIERTPADMVADALLRSAIDAQARAESQLSAAQTLGLGEAHPKMVQLKAAVAESRRRVDQLVRDYPIRRASQPVAPSPLSLIERVAALRRQLHAAEEEMRQIDARRAQLASFQETAATITQNLKATDARIDALATESSLSSRLTIVSAGDEPVAPSLDNRAKCAALGGLIGLGFPLGLLVLGGSIRRRYRYGDEILQDLSSQLPFVALLPDVATAGSLDSAAARCIHSLRVRLQPTDPGDSRIYLLTGTSPGEGTTSVALSLALSCAVAGLRALVIDCNQNNRRLTLGFEAGSLPGILEALTGAEPLVHRVNAGFCVMAAGQAGTQDAFKLPPAAFDSVFGKLRKRFDVILIDGEPILSGVISSTIAPQVDGVCAIVSRGQKQRLLASALEQIASLDATVAGVVFNRAAAGDFPAAMRQEIPARDTATAELPARLTRLGALVANALKSLSLSRETDLDLVRPESQAIRPNAASEAA
jgi:Mrp family chromosome partitioning ATPase